MTHTPFAFAPWLSPHHLASMQRGIEKEGLRMASNGYSAKTPHPVGLGSKLSHPYITTDYSENLLELITPPAPSIDTALQTLTKLHILVHQQLAEGELMWPLSMPCMLSDDDSDIPLADYGTSNIGKLKTLYRLGLGVRYGRKMQTIAGLHYNLSIGDDLFVAWQQCLGNKSPLTAFKNQQYLALIRNFKRLSPLVLYLTGASPSVCACFVKGREHHLIPLSDSQTTYYAPYATSLRMGKLGYTNSVQKALDIRYNTLDEYIAGLRQAIYTPFADFGAIGVDDDKGNPIQINDHILQIENEFYSPIRPKQNTQTGETPTDALKARGIAYVEFRAIDLDPYVDIGISRTTACLLECVALYCLLTPSAPLLPDEEQIIAENIERVVNDGRNPATHIIADGQSVLLSTWLHQHLNAMLPLSQLLDECHQTQAYSQAIHTMQTLVHDSKLTPSARIIQDSLAYGSTWKLGAALAKAHQATLIAQGLSDEDALYFDNIAKQSWQEQAELEQDTTPFADYLAPYRQTRQQKAED